MGPDIAAVRFGLSAWQSTELVGAGPLGTGALVGDSFVGQHWDRLGRAGDALPQIQTTSADTTCHSPGPLARRRPIGTALTSVKSAEQIPCSAGPWGAWWGGRPAIYPRPRGTPRSLGLQFLRSHVSSGTAPSQLPTAGLRGKLSDGRPKAKADANRGRLKADPAIERSRQTL